MGAAVVDLSEFVARRGPRPRKGYGAPAPRPTERPAVADEQFASPIDFCFWQGASGERYVHHVYSLIGCPQLPAANYALFARDADGTRTVLFIGRTAHAAQSLNLAEIRHRGAKLGANEVHVHMLARSEAERGVIEMDLRNGLGLDPDSRPLSA